jgi:hypothetical protein
VVLLIVAFISQKYHTFGFTISRDVARSVPLPVPRYNDKVPEELTTKESWLTAATESYSCKIVELGFSPVA